jgi:DNA-binding transcriptional LysR family regulator
MLKPTLSWDDFRYIKTIATTGTLAGAASALGVNHSTVFRRLAQIEDRAGAPLFERGRTGYALTARGEEMASVAGRMDDDILAFERRVAGQDMRPSGELRVTTNDTLLTDLLTELFADFRRAYPEIVLDIVVSNQSLNLSKRDADVAFRATERPPDALVGRRLAGIAWAVYGPAAALAKQKFDPAKDMHLWIGHDWIGLGDNLASLSQFKWLKAHIPAERIVYKVNTVLGLTEAAAAGIGLALLPCFLADKVPSLARLTPPDAAPAGGLWLLTHADLRHTARVRAFMDFATDYVSRQRKAIEGTA